MEVFIESDPAYMKSKARSTAREDSEQFPSTSPAGKEASKVFRTFTWASLRL